MSSPCIRQDLKDFCGCFSRYFQQKALRIGRRLDQAKSWLAGKLYWQRGRYARPFIHSGMVLLLVAGLTLGPTLISETFPEKAESQWQETILPGQVLSAAVGGSQLETATLVSLKPRSEVFEYTVQEGDTVSTIAEKFGISIDTIRWANDLESIKSIKVGQTLKILPVTGIIHEVKHGETIHSIAEKYSVDAQAIVNWPYNSYANDETFALAVGQELMVPDGAKPKETPWQPQRYLAQTVPVPDVGLQPGSGQFIWPAAGRITQRFVWYHQGLDIANKAAPDVVAADTGIVETAGWMGGYGNLVVINHQNGYHTYYGHFSSLYVSAGQRVAKGQALGRMGSTGRSSGIHVHFEVRQNGVALDPLSFLQ